MLVVMERLDDSVDVIACVEESYIERIGLALNTRAGQHKHIGQANMRAEFEG